MNTRAARKSMGPFVPRRSAAALVGLTWFGMITVAGAGHAATPPAAPAQVPALASGKESGAKESGKDPAKDAAQSGESFFAFSATTIDGQPQSLAGYKGKVVLVVNVASECYYTRQYPALQKLYEEYQPRGVVVLGFPSNDFGGQEPGTEHEIKSFCTSKYRVTFPLFQKVKTLGADASPIYRFLTSKAGAPKWNFHKYLIGKDGKVLAAFPSAVAPDDNKLREAIEKALKS